MILKKMRMLTQPDDVTCGPTSLHSVYNYYNYDIELGQVIKDVNFLEGGGTLAVFLGIDAIKKGFKVTLYSYNLKIFDPSWRDLPSVEIIEKLQKQLEYKSGKKFRDAVGAYINFLSIGGTLKFDPLTRELIEKYITRNIPILTGLSATYLYQSKREYTNAKNVAIADDVKGYATGHFVVICAIKPDEKVAILDPYFENPISQESYYEVEFSRLLNAIMLGVITYDGNLLIIEKK